MKLETVRLIKDGLANPTDGIDAKIGALTLDGTDARPSSPNRYFDIDDRWVARRRLDDDESSTATFPALAVFQFGPLRVLDPEVQSAVRDVVIQIAYAYLIKKQDSAEAIRDALYFNRAFLRWHAWFMSNAQTSAFRTKNGVIIRTVTELSQDDVHEEWGAADCVAASIATYRVRETSPT